MLQLRPTTQLLRGSALRSPRLGLPLASIRGAVGYDLDLGCRAHASGLSKALAEELRNFKAATIADESAALAESSQLRDQVAGLEGKCVEMTQDLRRLSHLLRRSQGGSSNLMHDAPPQDEAGASAASRNKFRPTVESVANQPTNLSQLDNECVAAVAMSDMQYSADKERLLREIMQVENVSWEEAHLRLYEMDEDNEKYYWSQSFPYRLGIVASTVGAIGSYFLVFNRPVAELYGTQVANEDLPDGVDSIDQLTWNQVGTWTWAWMEPVLGTASFVILCMQFGRSQTVKMGMRPYTEAMQSWRADRLARRYPQFDKSLVRAWAAPLPKVRMTTLPSYKRYLGFNDTAL